MSLDGLMVSEPEGEPLPGSSLEPAGFWIRDAARVVDWVVMGGVGLMVALLFGLMAGAIQLMTGRSANAFMESLGKTTFIGWIGSIVATVAYYSLFEGVAVLTFRGPFARHAGRR